MSELSRTQAARVSPSPAQRALMAAASFSSASGVISALREGADPMRADAEGRTALMLVCANRNGEIAKCVLALLPVSDPLARDEQGQTALMKLAETQEGSVFASEALRALQALLPVSDPLARDNEGRTALRFAASLGNAEITRALLPVSDPLAVDSTGMNALMSACCGIRDGTEWEDGIKGVIGALLPVSDLTQRERSGILASGCCGGGGFQRELQARVNSALEAKGLLDLLNKPSAPEATARKLRV